MVAMLFVLYFFILHPYVIDGVRYWIATDRFDLTTEEIALIYQLRWEVEKFFKWWKQHLHVYHLIARSEYGLMVQILTGLITYLLLAIYCQEQHGEKVSIRRVRELRAKINNELRHIAAIYQTYQFYDQNLRISGYCYYANL